MTQSTVRRWSNPETILVVTNLLEGPSVMLHATYQARLSGAKILLVHVIRSSTLRADPSPGMPSMLPSPALRVVQATLDNMVRAFEREGILCEPVILRGIPTEQIPLLVKCRGVERVLVAARSARGVERLLMGSPAEELAAVLDIPVCIIGQGAHPGPHLEIPPGRILVATSFRPGSSLCVSFACAFAEAHHARLTLLHVLESARLCGGSQYVEAQVATGAARQKLSDGIPGLFRERCEIDLEVRVGDPAAEILEVAGSTRYDFIILGSPPASIVSRILGSSVIHRVVSEANCPVIMVKPVDLTVKATTHELFYAKPDSAKQESSILTPLRAVARTGN
jgi:nucleotide-binding universal stress UspA family protein